MKGNSISSGARMPGGTVTASSSGVMRDRDRRLIGVSTQSGQMQFTRIPAWSESGASAALKRATPALVAA